jgi:hypothetical protein
VASPGKRSYLLRVRPEVLDAVERLAASELRSTNAQLEMLLREALERRGLNLPQGRKPEPDSPPE